MLIDYVTCIRIQSSCLLLFCRHILSALISFQVESQTQLLIFIKKSKIQCLTEFRRGVYSERLWSSRRQRLPVEMTSVLGFSLLTSFVTSTHFLTGNFSFHRSYNTGALPGNFMNAGKFLPADSVLQLERLSMWRNWGSHPKLFVTQKHQLTQLTPVIPSGFRKYPKLD